MCFKIELEKRGEVMVELDSLHLDPATFIEFVEQYQHYVYCDEDFLDALIYVALKEMLYDDVLDYFGFSIANQYERLLALAIEFLEKEWGLPAINTMEEAQRLDVTALTWLGGE